MEAEARKEKDWPVITWHQNHKQPSLTTVAGLSLQCSMVGAGGLGGKWVKGVPGLP